MRPIDQLTQILVQMADKSPENFSLHEFDAFATKFTIREICCMLVQIICEQDSGEYYYSKKVNDAILLGRKSERREQYLQA